MAIVFLKQKIFQKGLIFIFIIVLLITGYVIWQGFFGKKAETLPEGAVPLIKREVKINYQVLESSLLEKLQPFSAIEPFVEATPTEEVREKIGRDNPFLSY